MTGLSMQKSNRIDKKATRPSLGRLQNKRSMYKKNEYFYIPATKNIRNMMKVAQDQYNPEMTREMTQMFISW